jgi:L-lactate dehydrogenase complex protein LldG
MTTAREEILTRIRTATADLTAGAGVVRDYRTGLEPGETLDLVELFVDRLTDYRATVHRAGPEDTAAVIATVLAGRRVRRLVVPAGFPAEHLPPGPSGLILIGDEPLLSPTELDGLDGVVTTSTVAIAETGTIVLDAGPGQGRRVLTLVPDYHLCVVRAADIVRGVPEAVARLRPGDAPAPLTWISGPSATSDIELQRVEGVHGPRTLDVVLVS